MRQLKGSWVESEEAPEETKEVCDPVTRRVHGAAPCQSR